MDDSLKFGTSGLRGLASDLIGAAGRYCAAFVTYLSTSGAIASGSTVLIGEDLRASSPAIARTVAAAIAALGHHPIHCGQLPTPALALEAQRRGVPAIMVTGSHIPADRNGLKFYGPRGEIDKADEAGILAALGAEQIIGALEAAPSADALRFYQARYAAALGKNCLSDWRIGVFEHSSVARDLLVGLMEGFGAAVVRLGRSGDFIALDTEAVEPGVTETIRQWTKGLQLDALISTDGDADRPLLADSDGALVRGDSLGWLTAKYLRADAVVTPVTSNSAIEASGDFASVIRTRVGSPYVIAGLHEAAGQGRSRIVGLEANGGVLLGSDVTLGDIVLTALPTRDAVLPILAVQFAARQAGKSIAELVATLPPRIATSGRLEHVPAARSAALLADLSRPDTRFFAEQGKIAGLSSIDGLRFTLAGGDVIHYRASGNAPELRCYTEAATAERANALLKWGLAAAERHMG